MVERSGFELPVPLISNQNARSLPVSFSPSALLGANGENGTDRKRPRSLEQAEPAVRIHSASSLQFSRSSREMSEVRARRASHARDAVRVKPQLCALFVTLTGAPRDAAHQRPFG
jgi:hypothetical protein